MKKYLFLLLSVLSIFFISDRVDALSFTLNGQETTVTKENFIYYVYQNYTSYFENYKYFVASNDLDNNKTYNVFFSNCSYLKNPTDFPETYYHPTGCQVYRIYTKSLNTDFTVQDYGKYRYLKMGGIQYLLYSNYDILSTQDNSVLFSANLTKEDLEKGGKKPIYKITYYLNNEVYKEIEVEKGSSHTLEDYSYNKDLYLFSGWSIDDNKDLSNITSDISIHATLEEKQVNAVYVKNFPETQVTKNEFYALLVLLATLIMIIVLKWCFPFRGGKDL